MRLLVGRVARAHGVAGELVVAVHTDDPEHRFAPGSELLAGERADGALRPVVVDAARPFRRDLLVRLHGVADRSSAEALRGWLLLADSADCAPTDDPEEFWDHDLIGLAAATPAGRPLGEVADVLHGPAGAMLCLRRPEGGEVLVPFVAAVVPEVDLAGGRVTVDPPPGLLEL